MSMPWDFVGYILIAVFAVVFAGAVVVGLLVAIVRRVRNHNARVALAQAQKRGYTVLDVEDGMTDADVTALLDGVFGPTPQSGYDDRDRWQS